MTTKGHQTVFDGEQWNWSRAYSETEEPMSNVVTIPTYFRSPEYHEIFVNIPADFFRYFMRVHKDRNICDAVLYLDMTVASKYVFGYSLGIERDGRYCEDCYDLWTYHGIPEWLDPKN